MRICHIAPFNTAGVPYTFVQAERDLGHESRLITLAGDPQGRTGDICLQLPYIDSSGTRWIKQIVTPKERRHISHTVHKPDRIPIVWRPTLPERFLIGCREWIWGSRIRWFLRRIDLFEFDVIQLDGGLGFYRDARIIRELKAAGKKIICCYTGSDLRARGVISGIDAISDLNVSVEFDHVQFHPHIHHVPFPLKTTHLDPVEYDAYDILIIGHAPTNREAKGSHHIIPVIRELERTYSVKLILIEKLPYAEAIARKRSCHIFIDQIGNLGYGVNGIEALAMGIPTCSSLAEGFEIQYPDHPFVEIDAKNLKERLIELIGNPCKRKKIGQKGVEWVRKVHDPKEAVLRIHTLAGLY